MDPFRDNHLVDFMYEHYYMFPWQIEASLIFVNYVSKTISYPAHGSPMSTIKHINKLLKEKNSLKWWFYRDGRAAILDKMERKDQQVVEIFTNTFLTEMDRFFKVPKLNQLSDKDESLDKNEILACFLQFLIQILDCEREETYTFRSIIHWLKWLASDMKEMYALLVQNLKFLLVVLGDAPFQYMELEQVQDILAEYETTANEAGTFVYSFVFGPRRRRYKKLGLRIRGVLQKVEFLNEKIIAHCIKFSKLPNSRAAPRFCSVDPLYVVTSLLRDIEDLVDCRFDLIINEDIKDHIKVLHEELTMFRTFLRILKDHKSHIYSDELKEIMMQANDTGYEVEYLITTYVAGTIPIWYLNLRLPVAIQRLEVMRTRLEETKKIDDIEGLTDFGGELPVPLATRILRPDVDAMVIGFEESRTKILDHLIGRSENRQTISIFGMPGLGKTTMAKKLYNDRAICDYFDLRAWCVVSQTYHKRYVLSDIMMSLGSTLNGENLREMEHEKLGLDVHKLLKGRRYLIVLDDIWHSSTCDDVMRYFPDDGNGSRILLTSRIKDTAPINSIFYTPPLLSRKQCWNLLRQRVFLNEEPCPLKLVPIGKGIASKCHGLPLAVVVVAGILANLDKEEHAWKKVGRNMDLYISNDPSNYMKMLELSYEHLPNHLKQCFLYFGMFPEDMEIQTRELIPMWIAEGLVHNEENPKNPEYVAAKYLLGLINRSLLMVTRRKYDGGIKACRIHDVLRDMCIRKGHEANFLKYTNNASMYQKQCYRAVSTANESLTISALHCRSLFGQFDIMQSSIAQTKHVRVIHQPNGKISYSSTKRHIRRTSISHLVHLRYLRFPEIFPVQEICKLVNLEYLHLECQGEVYLPSTILKLVKLRHIRVALGVTFVGDHSSLPPNNLKSLSCFTIKTHNDNKILICSPNLRRLKCYYHNTLSSPAIHSLAELESLNLCLTSSLISGLSKVRFPLTLKKLSLKGNDCLRWERIMVVGSLPNLQFLKLEKVDHCDGWETMDGEFKELRILKLDDCSLEKWTTSSDHLPKLQCLVLNSCHQLQEIPNELGDIPTLKKIEMHDCGFWASLSAVRIDVEQRDEYGNEELEVIIKRKGYSKEEFLRMCGKDSRKPKMKNISVSLKKKN